MRDSLRDLRPAEFLQVTRRIANDTFEQRLLDVSDRGYGLVLSAVQGTFAEDFVGFAFRGFAVSAMQSLDDSNRVLVQQGLLPPFTLF